VLTLLLVAAACGKTDKPSPAPSPATPPATPLDASPAPLDAGAAPSDASPRVHPAPGQKHMSFDDDPDAGSVPQDHADRLWGDYVDREGKPSVGWHSHDPVTGNAR
jgi:hypothetical protein